MAKIKLKDYCKREGISYITGYRWYKSGKLPVKAYQTETGTILVDDEGVPMITNKSNYSAISVLLNKTMEFSEQNRSLIDLATYMIVNFQLILNTEVPIKPIEPVYSKNKPDPKKVRDEYFSKFYPDENKVKPLKVLKENAKSNIEKYMYSPYADKEKEYKELSSNEKEFDINALKIIAEQLNEEKKGVEIIKAFIDQEIKEYDLKKCSLDPILDKKIEPILDEALVDKQEEEIKS